MNVNTAKSLPFASCLGIVCVHLFLLFSPIAWAGVPEVRLDVDWEKFLGNLDPQWEQLPAVPKHGPMVGNGMLGTYMIQERGKGALRFEMSREDLCDVRAGFNRRKTNGYFRLSFRGKRFHGTCRLHLWNAEFVSRLQVGDGMVRLRVFCDANSDVIVFELEDNRGSVPFEWEWVPDTRGWAGKVPKVRSGYVPYPAPVLVEEDGCRVSVQDMPVAKKYWTEREPAPSQHATAWKILRT
ncbi:MAG: hypothetical protein D6820_04925, partial [Lentisphaerae bacterium]